MSFLSLFPFLLKIDAQAAPAEKARKSLSAFPILMNEMDIGVDYGGKAKFVNYFSKKESLDLKAEYDKFLKYSFYGIGAGLDLIDKNLFNPRFFHREPRSLSLGFQA